MNIMREIYTIKNTTTGRVYVGSSRTLGRRIWQEKNSLRRGDFTNKPLQDDFIKLGEAAFIWTILQPSGNIRSERNWFLHFKSQPAGVYNIRSPRDTSGEAPKGREYDAAYYRMNRTRIQNAIRQRRVKRFEQSTQLKESLANETKK